MDLTSYDSNIGDWKVIKCMEAYMIGNPMPYDIKELHDERQKVRDQINSLELNSN